MHLNQLAAFLPSFEAPTEWDPASNIPRSFPHHQAVPMTRNLHRFVPLPTDTRPPPSMASHGDLPPHFVLNPESDFHPTFHRDLHPAAPHSNRGTTHDDIHMVEDLRHPHDDAHPAPRAKQASRSTAPRSIAPPEDPVPARSSTRPRSVSMVEHVNRFSCSRPGLGKSSATESHFIWPVRPFSTASGPGL